MKRKDKIAVSVIAVFAVGVLVCLEELKIIYHL